MKNPRIALAFIPRPDDETGPPIMRIVARPLGGGEQYPEPYTNGAFLTRQEYDPDSLEAQARHLHAELDEAVKEAHRRYAAWKRSSA